jgi:hypothetical protein
MPDTTKPDVGDDPTDYVDHDGNTPPSHSNLAAALAAFQAQMPTVHKGKTAVVKTKAGGEYRYQYADLADVTRAAMPLLARHGLSFTAHPARTERGDYELHGTLLHTTTARGATPPITGSLPLYGNTAQELGSSITYARRYLLGCLTGIVTDDDEDGNVAQTAPRAQYDTAAEDRAKAEAEQAEKQRRYAAAVAAATAPPERVAALRLDVLGYADTVHDQLARKEHLNATWREAAEAGALGCTVAIPEPWQAAAGGNTECTLHDLIVGAQGPNLPPSGETTDPTPSDDQEAQQ